MDRVDEAYGALAARYIDLFGTVSSVHPDDLALIERHLTIETGTVLDVGCGPGHLSAHLASFGVGAVGIDLVPRFLQHARTARALDDLIRGSVRTLPLRDASVAGVLAWYSLIHLPPDEMENSLAELRRVADVGSVLVVGAFDGDEIATFAHQVAAAFTWPVDELSERLRRVGFVEVDRLVRPADTETGTRAHAAIVAVAR